MRLAKLPHLFPLLAVTLGCALGAAEYTVTVDLLNPGGPPKHGALGSLFGLSSLRGGPGKERVAELAPLVSQSQGRPGENGSNPYSTEAVAPLLRGTGARMICRFNDLCYGWAPYRWPGLKVWLERVRQATRAVRDGYADVTLCVAPLNEPDNKLNSPEFLAEPGLSGTYDERINQLWTLTVRELRSLAPALPVMGPNYEHYRPWTDPGHQVRMERFLRNAKETGTVPDIIGWHSLGPSPGDVPAALRDFYRPLEKRLGLGRKPICVEEFGDNGGEFEGVPGTMLKHIAAFERAGVDYGCTGIYTHNGTLSNTLRSQAWSSPLRRNGGWFLLSWYRSLAGNLVPVTRQPETYQALDGVATYDARSGTATLLLGGSSDTANLRFAGAAKRFGDTVRVRVEQTIWEGNQTEFDREHLPETVSQEIGGDPKDGVFTIFDTNLPTTRDGTLELRLPNLEKLNGYRVTLGRRGPPVSDPLKWEAEDLPPAARPSLRILGGKAFPGASGSGFAAGIDQAGSRLDFSVNVPAKGIYQLLVRHANGGSSASNQRVLVGGRPQGVVRYGPTGGWGPGFFACATRRVALQAGVNLLTLAKGEGSAEVDYIQLYRDTHRHEAENVRLENVKLGRFQHMNAPTFVGGIDGPGSAVEFTVEAPCDGPFQLLVSYANGGGAATHLVSVNGQAAIPLNLAPTGGWFGKADPGRVGGLAKLDVDLREGPNRIRFGTGAGHAELDWLELHLPE